MQGMCQISVSKVSHLTCGMINVCRFQNSQIELGKRNPSLTEKSRWRELTNRCIPSRNVLDEVTMRRFPFFYPLRTSGLKPYFLSLSRAQVSQQVMNFAAFYASSTTHLMNQNKISIDKVLEVLLCNLFKAFPTYWL